jgi:hypothetical protein
MNSEAARERLARALWESWDPIGVNAFDNTQDEYQAYVEEILDATQTAACIDEVFNCLWTLETQIMGLSGDQANTRSFAEWLFWTLKPEIV